MDPWIVGAEKLDGAELDVQRRTALWPAATTIALGFAILYVVGFAGPAAIHDAAHDARHSLNFPCH
jgi:cobalt transporter subunit CbtB